MSDAPVRAVDRSRRIIDGWLRIDRRRRRIIRRIGIGRVIRVKAAIPGEAPAPAAAPTAAEPAVEPAVEPMVKSAVEATMKPAAMKTAAVKPATAAHAAVTAHALGH